MEFLILKDTKVHFDFCSGGIGNEMGGQECSTSTSSGPYRVFKIKSGTICFCEIASEALFQIPTFQYIEQGEIINRVEL